MTKSKTAVLNLDKTTEYLQMPRSTAYRFAQEGKIPGQKVGRHWRFRRMVVERWLGNEQQRPSEA